MNGLIFMALGFAVSIICGLVIIYAIVRMVIDIDLAKKGLPSKKQSKQGKAPTLSNPAVLESLREILGSEEELIKFLKDVKVI